ncbi:hypothetical protein TNCV_346201 [Trichonephila clavipes]|nr:hypothetical protein TNCV_346201 [Trichonephila clavipes]
MLKSTYLTLAFRHDLLVDTPLRWMQGLYENSHSPTCDRKIAATCLINFVIFLLTFQVIHHELIHALAKPISRQTQDNSYSKFAFAKPVPFLHALERRRGDYLSTGCGNAIRSRQPFPFAFANAYFFVHLEHS